MSRPIGEPSIEDVDALLRFLPLFEAPEFDPGSMRSGAFVANPVLLDFIQALQDHHFVTEFDWTEWQPVAERYVHQPALLAGAGLGTLCKLFTTHLRREHYSEGHLAEIMRAGHLVALLRRLRELRGQLG